MRSCLKKADSTVNFTVRSIYSFKGGKLMVIIDNCVDFKPDFDLLETANKVTDYILDKEGCPFDVEIDILISDSEEIKEYNSEYRHIDNTTDVLSFPNFEWDEPAVFDDIDPDDETLYNPETNLLILGEIALNKDRILSQAEDYGHSVQREYAFLIAHSLLHLLGYDHLIEEEAQIMEAKQKYYLDQIGIKR